MIILLEIKLINIYYDYNIKFLEELSNNIQQSIKDLKSIFEKMNKNKEELKLNIQQIFTKIRSEINNREDQLLIEVDQKFENIFYKENIVKESQKLPIKIKDSLEKGKIIDIINYKLVFSFFVFPII